MIIKLGHKNELQTLGFRTYYNQCALVLKGNGNLQTIAIKVFD